MSNDVEILSELMGLDPLVEKTMSFRDFLVSLKDNPAGADTAASLFVRAIKDGGEESIEDAEEGRKQFLEMLKSMRIPAYKAFSGVRGSQRVVARMMKHYEAAAQNGYQLRQMLVLFGGPGSGKSFLVDKMIKVLEGKIVYAVKGCPEHENPLNLLKLLPSERLLKLSEALGLLEKDGSGTVTKDHLFELMKAAQEPCAHCFKTLMGIEATACDTDGSASTKETVKHPNLKTFEVEALRLSSRNAGIAVWSPSADNQGCSLSMALRQGNRGLTRLQEAFDANGEKQGEVSELQILLEASEGRRMAASSVSCESSAGFIPLDELIVLETNEGAWNQFIKQQKDPDKFTRRSRILTMYYNTVVCEEVAAYKDFIRQLKAVPAMDPLALHVIATLAVASRMKDAVSTVPGGDEGPDLHTRIRMYNGEPLKIEKKASPIARSPYGGFGGALGTADARPAGSDAAEKNLSVSDIWIAAGDEEGKYGLNMGFMLSAVSQLCELALGAKHQTVTALSAMSYLKARIELEVKRPGLTDSEKKVIERCLGYLEMQTTRGYGVKPKLIEAEYRRLLKQQVLQAFSPDYDTRAQEMFARYKAHASAWAQNKTEVHDERFGRKIKIDVGHLDKIEGAMGKWGEDAANFRRSLESEFIELMQATARDHGEDECKHVSLDWQTHPDIKKAIKKLLDDEIAQKVEKVIGDETNLTSDERKLRDESLARFDRFGYSEISRKAALAYFKEFELWK